MAEKTNWASLFGIGLIALIVGCFIGGTYIGGTMDCPMCPELDTNEYDAKISELEATIEQNENDTASLLETIAEQDETVQTLMDEQTAFYDEYVDEIREVEVRKVAVDWFKENYLDELNLDTKAYEDYEFDVLIESVEFMDIDAEDDEDSTIEFDFHLNVNNGTTEELYPGEAKIIVEEDNDVDDAEISVVGFP